MAKARIELVDVRDDGSVIVFYTTGTCRPYKSKDYLPKTALAWLEEHPQHEPVRFTATPEGVVVEHITEQNTEQAETSVMVIDKADPEPAADPVKVVISPVAAVMLTGLMIARAAVLGVLAIVRALGLLADGTERMIRAVNKAWWMIYPPVAKNGRIWANMARIWVTESWQFRRELLITNIIGEPE